VNRCAEINRSLVARFRKMKEGERERERSRESLDKQQQPCIAVALKFMSRHGLRVRAVIFHWRLLLAGRQRKSDIQDARRCLRYPGNAIDLFRLPLVNASAESSGRHPRHRLPRSFPPKDAISTQPGAVRLTRAVPLRTRSDPSGTGKRHLGCNQELIHLIASLRSSIYETTT